MSRMRLAKKLQPAKKAWKSFSNTVQHKLHKLNISKAIKTTLQRLLSAINSLGHLIHSRLHHSSLTTTRSQHATSYYHVVQHEHCAAIHIDDLFDKANSVSMAMHAIPKGSDHPGSVHGFHSSLSRTNAHTQEQGKTSTSKGKEKEEHGIYKGNNLVGESSGGLNTIEDAWKAVVAKSPLLHVDQKAEEFISKFRKDMRLQKERSMLEFQEMLARST